MRVYLMAETRVLPNVVEFLLLGAVGCISAATYVIRHDARAGRVLTRRGPSNAPTGWPAKPPRAYLDSTELLVVRPDLRGHLTYRKGKCLV